MKYNGEIRIQRTFDWKYFSAHELKTYIFFLKKKEKRKITK